MAKTEFVECSADGPTEQSQVLDRIRPLTRTVELVFHDLNPENPLLVALSGLNPVQQLGVGIRPGYGNPSPQALLLRYKYSRQIFTALRECGGLFRRWETARGDRVEFTRLGNTDLTLLDADGAVLGYTVTHAGLVFLRQDLV